MNTTQGSKIASSIFIGRWTPKILFSLKERPHRHGELRHTLGRVSQRMLTRTLRNLEPKGLVAKASDEIERNCCRVFLDAYGADNHYSTPRHVPLGKTLPQDYECRRASFGWTRDALSEVDIC